MGNQTDKEQDILCKLGRQRVYSFTLFSVQKNPKDPETRNRPSETQPERHAGEERIKMRTWKDVRLELYTAEEIRESNLRVAIIGELIKARQEKNISQRELEHLSGVKQPIISRMEAGETSPQLDTVLRVLAPLGKTLAVVPIE
jgi:ribosome-binding protein aMBF1 (putative translation factor)